MDYTRQKELINQNKLSTSQASIIGCGALGSMIAMTLSKMGVNIFDLYDDDGVSAENLPNQMFFNDQINAFKVDAISDTMKRLNTDVDIAISNKKYYDQELRSIVIVATDNMASRRLIWDEFKKQQQCYAYIEVRMGAEEGQIYTIRKMQIKQSDSLLLSYNVTLEDMGFYEDRLYGDEVAKEAPCTARAIIYNVLMISSLACRAYKAIIEGSIFPRELVFGMSQIHKYSFQVRR